MFLSFKIFLILSSTTLKIQLFENQDIEVYSWRSYSIL